MNRSLISSGSILELAAFHSLRTHNLKAYTTYNASLQPFYSFPDLSPSPNRPVILGLHLLALLSGGQLTDFHTVLERLQADELNDSFVKLPVDLYVSFRLRSLGTGSIAGLWCPDVTIA